jgi:signal transduction histidine kinase
MRERVALVGGTIDIDSRAGEGTTIRAAFPARRTDEQTIRAAIDA